MMASKQYQNSIMEPLGHEFSNALISLLHYMIDAGKVKSDKSMTLT